MKTRRQDGYTLIEQVMVMFIIGAILAMVVGLSKYASHRADESLARADLETFRMVVNDYVTTYGRLPAPELLATSAFRSRLPKGFSFEAPWAHPYVYVTNAPQSFAVFSTGPDGTQGTHDDVYPGLD